jgi:hypothetical protein
MLSERWAARRARKRTDDVTTEVSDL